VTAAVFHIRIFPRVRTALCPVFCLLVAASILLSCSRTESLVADGEVWHAPHPYVESFLHAAQQVPGLEPRVLDEDSVENDRTVLVWGRLDAEWNQRKGGGVFMDVSPVLDGTGFGETLSRGILLPTTEGFFIPTHLSYYGLFLSSDLGSTMDGVGTWSKMENILFSYREGGRYPIAVGGAFASSASIWPAMIDLRLNGAERYGAFLSGERSIDEPDFDGVFNTLRRWKRAELFHPDSWRWSAKAALTAVEQGQSGAALLNAAMASRLSKPDAVEFAPVPTGTGRDTTAGIARIYGYSVTGSRDQLESALAWAKSVAATELPLAGLRPVLSPGVLRTDDGGKSYTQVLPAIDDVLDPQDSYDIGRSLTRFFKDPEFSASELRRRIGLLLTRQ
jgi:hypothetical protein